MLTIDTDVLTILNANLKQRTDAFERINKYNTDEQIVEVKPKEIIGDKFDAKEWCGEPGDESDQTIAGCINKIGMEMAQVFEGIIMTDEDGEEEEEESRRPRGNNNWSGGDDWTPDPETPTEEEPTDETPTEEEPTDENPTEDEEVVVAVTPTVDSLIDQFNTDSTDPTTNNGLGTLTVTKDGTIITDENGNPTGTATTSQYKVYEELKDGNGNVIAVRVSPDGTEPEQWIRVVQDGVPVGSYYETNQVGSFDCTSGGIPIYDKDNNLIGQLEPGKYKVYAIASDSNSNVTAIRISKDGEPEQWIQIYKDGKYIDGGTFEQYGYTFTNPQNVDLGNGSKVTISSSKNKILGGVLGVLVVGLGATIYVKKKQENGDSVADEEALPEGEYNIYDYKSDEDGNITSAKISEEGSPEEQWVEF